MDSTVASSPPPLASEQITASQKRKRSISPSHALPSPPPTKAPRTTNASHLHINYLVRQYDEILPLITSDDTLPALLALIADYDGVLQRHESMAGNLGARPLGPMIIKRFERLFDGPPRVLKTHGKEGTQVNWLDVVEFARNKPEQFNLEKMRDGVRVCQFYTKQCRVEIPEEDFELLRSGVPQKMIPPQPIGEDEEKELGTLEILEKNLGGVVQLADQVSARARQLNHRLKNRKSAIISRRQAEAEARREEEEGGLSPPFGENGGYLVNGVERPSVSPTSGFTAVNSRPSLSHGQSGLFDDYASRPSVATNGTSSHGASAATRDELLSKFRTTSDRDTLTDSRLASQSYSSSRPSLAPKSASKSKMSPTELDYPNNLIAATAVSQQGGVPIPHTPTSLLAPGSGFSKALAADLSREDSGPFKPDMMLRMEQLNRADRVQPPCDRCRRLHMDCLKNLTACIGCTKKHAKCSWKDVTERELQEFPLVLRMGLDGAIRGEGAGKSGSEGGSETGGGKRRDWSAEAKLRREVDDAELLGEDSDEEMPAAPSTGFATVNATAKAPGQVLNLSGVLSEQTATNGHIDTSAANGAVPVPNAPHPDHGVLQTHTGPITPPPTTTATTATLAASSKLAPQADMLGLDRKNAAEPAAEAIAYPRLTAASLNAAASAAVDGPVAAKEEGEGDGDGGGERGETLTVYTAGAGASIADDDLERSRPSSGSGSGSGSASASGSGMRWDEESGRMRLGTPG